MQPEAASWTDRLSATSSWPRRTPASRPGSTSTTTAHVVTTPLAAGLRRRRPRLRRVPRQVRDGRLQPAPDRSTTTARTFQHFLWADMPGALLPDDAGDRRTGRLVLAPRSSASCRCRARAIGTCRSRSAARPSTSWSAIRRRRCSTAPRTATAGATSTRSACGPTTSRPAPAATSTTTPATSGGLKPGEKFVIAGDQNSDPLDGDSIPGSIQQLLDNPRVNTQVTPASAGGPAWAQVQGGAQPASTRATRPSIPPTSATRRRCPPCARPRQPAGRLRAARAGACGSSTPRSSGRRRATRWCT